MIERSAQRGQLSRDVCLVGVSGCGRWGIFAHSPDSSPAALALGALAVLPATAAATAEPDMVVEERDTRAPESFITMAKGQIAENRLRYLGGSLEG